MAARQASEQQLRRRMSLQNFWDGLNIDAHILVPVSGDCIERLDICDGDLVEVDLAHMPKPPKYLKHDGENYTDTCMCFGRVPGENRQGSPHPTVMMIKAYMGKFLGMQSVATCYAPETLYKPDENSSCRMDFQFEPFAIFGVVCACYDRDGNLKWKRDTSNHPVTLSPAEQCRGGNCGPVRKAAT